jgi:hypothetical protein
LPYLIPFLDKLIKLNAGKYRLRVKHGGNDSNAVSEADIEVTAGQLAEQTMVLNGGYLRLTSVPAAGSASIKRTSTTMS